MSRTYILQSLPIAISIGRMKVDANYVGVASQEEQEKLTQNHVFLRRCWSNGIITIERLNYLVHQVMEDDIVYATSELEDNVLLQLAELAQRQRFKLVICMVMNRQLPIEVFSRAYRVFQFHDAGQNTAYEKMVKLQSYEQCVAMIGAYALCLMNGLDDYATASFYERAIRLGGQPWYDEIAYQELK